MLHNYFKIAWRKLQKNKLYSFINIIGLTVGLASCLLIGIYLYNELSFDNFHTNADKIVRVSMEYRHGTDAQKMATTGTKTGPQLKRTFPDVQAFVRTLKSDRIFESNGQVFDEQNVFYADDSFFKVFSFKLLKGNANDALNAPDRVVLSESSAKKYFGDQDPIGKILKSGTKVFTVSAVVANPPNNSQMHFDFVLPFNVLSSSKSEEWFTANYITYLLLKDAIDIVPLQKQVKNYMQGISTGELKMTGGDYLTLHLEPLKSVHLHSAPGFEPNGSLVYIYILFTVALLTLTIAAVNYTNLAVAQSAGRSAEISIRKVLGAGAMQLFRQFIGESVFFTTVAAILAIMLAWALLPQFNIMAGENFTNADLINAPALIALFLLSTVISFIAGSYPALLLSNLKIAALLKSGFSFSGSSSVRQSLIIFQFVVSFFLIISTGVIVRQLKYVQTKDVGYSRNNIVVLPVNYQLYPKVTTLKTQLAAIPHIKQISTANSSPVDVRWSDNVNNAEGKKLSVNCIPADENFIPMFNIKLLAGSNYTHADVLQMLSADNEKDPKYSFIINETTAKEFGWTPEQAVGKTITKYTDGVVKGVVKDFNFKSLHDPITPLIIFLDNHNINNIYLKVDGNNTQKTLSDIETVWKQQATGIPFQYHFLDEEYNAIYKAEQRTAAIFKTFSVLAILLACLGLFALTAFSVLHRTKEIGIRKVLGASVTNITLMLSKNFLKLVFIAILIASPVAWLAMNKWLQDFAYRIDIPWYMFVTAALATIIIAFVTVSFQSIKAAVSTPITSLRND